MLPQRTKVARIGCLLSLLFLLAGGIVLADRYQATNRCRGSEPLLTSFTIIIDPSQNQQLIEQSRQFAYKHSFRFDTADFDQPASDLRILMTRRDVEIVTRISSHPGGFEAGFYNRDCIHPTVASDISDLVNDYKNFMGQIPNVTITQIQ